jgi:hypothetical protein
MAKRVHVVKQNNTETEVAVQLVASDPVTLQADQFWYNTSSNALRYSPDGISTIDITSASGSAFVEDGFVDSIALNNNIVSETNILALSFAHAVYDAVLVEYRIREASSNKVRIGRLLVSFNSSSAEIGDDYSEVGGVMGQSANNPLKFSATIIGANCIIRYRNTDVTNASIMRCRLTKYKL